MGRLFVTGDTHSTIDWKKLNTKNWEEQRNLTRDDHLLIAGDFGAPWVVGESYTDEYVLDTYESRNYTTLFIDGNHENFHALAQYPIVTYKGAKCHQLRAHVFHVMRGEVLELGAHVIWCMGGARSTDIHYRTTGVNHWEEEVPSYRELEYGAETLRANMERINMIVTHDAPDKAIDAIDKYRLPYTDPKMAVMPNYLQFILDEMQDKSAVKWYFGHYHIDSDFQLRAHEFHAMYERILEV
nr:MAG TPA: metallophosphatase domain protein [Caudoviricetes sp.]